MGLILFYCLLNTIIEHLLWCRILQTEGPLNHVVGIGQLSSSEPILIAESTLSYNWLVYGE